MRPRSLALALAALAAAAVVAVPVPSTPSGAAPTVERLAGADRYATAAEVSRSMFTPGVGAVFVAAGATFADALAAGPAAAARRAPVLLVEHDRVPAPTAAELERLRPDRIVVVGGGAAVSDTVVERLRSYAPDVTRRYGDDRFATAAAVSAASFPGGAPVAYVANGGSFADALAGGPAAGVAGGPVLLTDRDGLPGATVAELQRLKPQSIVVLGGIAVVGPAVESHLRQLAASVGRSEGADRYATSVAVSKNTFPNGAAAVFVATGATFPDALAGGPLGALTPGPILLVQRDCMPDVVRAEVDRLGPARLVVLGGASAVADTAADGMPCPVHVGPRTPTVVAHPTTPAFDDDAPDPHVVRLGNAYYAFTTGTTWGNRIGVLVADNPNGPFRTTTGRTFGSTALASIPSWQTPDTQWAPGVFAWGGRYVMFYAARQTSTGRWCVSVATADAPAGPYVDRSSGPLVCQYDIGGSIDPQPFVDGGGRPWLHWKNNDEFSPAVSKVWAAPLDASGTALAGPPQEVMAKDSVRHPWQNTVDNPQMVLHGGVHYLFFSSGDWSSDRYVVGYAVCDGPTGPCRQPSPGPILASYAHVAGPAGGTAVRGTDGRWWLSYHAWTAGCTAYSCGGERKLYVAPLEFR